MAEKKEFDLTTEVVHITNCYLTCTMFIIQEIHRLEEALKKEEFRKLLVDYAKEIRDPDNRKVSVSVLEVFNKRAN